MNLKFLSMMVDAINTKNHQRMNDILERYHGNLDVGLDELDNNLLILTVIQGDFVMLEILLTKGCEVNWQNKLGNTALHYSVERNFNKCTDILLCWQADESILNELD